MSMRHFDTRSIEECQRLVALWDEGKKEKFIKEFGGEPNDQFLRDFRVKKLVKPKAKSKAASRSALEE